MTVMVVAAILFILITSALAFSLYYSTQTQSFVKRTQAMQLADAGLNQYLYQLSQNYAYWQSSPTLGPTAMSGGSWAVTATAPTNTTPLTLRSTGTLPDGTRRTVTATVRFPTFSDYTVFVDLRSGTYSIGSGATFYGPVRCNGNISNSGVITGLAQAGGTCTAGSSFSVNYPGGYRNGAQIVNFSALTTNLNELKAIAISQGSYYGASGALGYQASISGAQVVISKITAINYNYPRTGVGTDPQLGVMTLTPIATLPIPASGVLFFDDNVWTQGTYDAALTIATSRDAYATGNILPSSTNTTHSCGIVAASDVLFPYWMQTMPAAQTVQAAMLAESGGVGPDTAGAGNIHSYNTSTRTWSTNYTPPLKTSITVAGSRAMELEIGFSSGYSTRSFLIDPRLKSSPPPQYPEVPGDSLKVDTWSEN
jgi:type II secretory pathway pseudopilin PulG